VAAAAAALLQVIALLLAMPLHLQHCLQLLKMDSTMVPSFSMFLGR